MSRPILKIAILNSVAMAAYVALVGTFIFYAGRLNLGQTPLVPVFILMLLVFSAALTGTLVFGKPVLLYMDGKKEEALSLLVYTLGFIFVIVTLAFAGLLLFKAY